MQFKKSSLGSVFLLLVGKSAPSSSRFTSDQLSKLSRWRSSLQPSQQKPQHRLSGQREPTWPRGLARLDLPEGRGHLKKEKGGKGGSSKGNRDAGDRRKNRCWSDKKMPTLVRTSRPVTGCPTAPAAKAFWGWGVLRFPLF